MSTPRQDFEILQEVGLTVPSTLAAKIAAARDIFARCGFPAEKLVETRDSGQIRLSVFLGDARTAAKLRQGLNQRRFPGAKVTLRNLKDRDWVDRWKDGIKPFRLTARLDVVPAWCVSSSRPSRRHPVCLDTTLAFGTGLHETTRFMSQLIESKRGKYGSFLDIGTGTGLLAIVALLNGAQRVEGVDLDQGCLNVARQNLAANQLAFDRIYAGDFAHLKVPGRFDLVAANLNTFDLLRLKKRIVSKVRPGGYLAVSGIAVNLYRQFRDGFCGLPLHCLRVRTGKKWVACLFKKKGETR